MTTRINMETVGAVPQEFADKTVSTLASFYEALSSAEPPSIVDVYIYHSRDRMLAALEREAMQVGVAVVADYLVMHEAWRGWPRIHVDYGRCSLLPWHTFKALLLHEAGHSVLHGNLLAYVVSIPRVSWPGGKVVEAAYVASTAVKDLEVSLLLKADGFTDELEEYARYVAGSMAELSCRDPLELLELAKLLAPYVTLERRPPSRALRGNCRALAVDVMEVLRSTAGLGSLDDAVFRLVTRVLELTRRQQDIPRP